MERNAVYQELTPVFCGDPTEVVLARSLLEAHGLQTFIANENIKHLDPFITGANALTMVLMGPADRAEEIAEILAAMRSRESRPELEPEPEEPLPSDPVEVEEAERLGRRIRFGAVMLFTVPIAAVLGVKYLAKTWSSGVYPRQHTFNTLASLFCIAVTGVLLVVLLQRVFTG